MNDLFTPSEIVLLHGEKFVRDRDSSKDLTFLSDIKELYRQDDEEIAEFTKETFSTLSSLFSRDELAAAFFSPEIYLLDKRTKVDVLQLATSILVVAILANVWSGNFSLKMETKKIFFSSITSLSATLEKEYNDWNDYSLENFIIQKIKTKTKLSIKYDVVFAWINQDSFHIASNEYTPYKSVVNLVKKGMEKRKILQKIPKKSFNLFPYTEYELEQSKFLSDTEILVRPILDKIQKYKLYNPEIWNFLLQRIKSGIQSAKKD